MRVEGSHLPFDASQRSVVLIVGDVRLLLDTGATGVVLFDFDGLDIEVHPRTVRRVSTNDGHRIARSGWIRRLDIGDESFRRVPVTLVPQTGLDDPQTDFCRERYSNPFISITLENSSS